MNRKDKIKLLQDLAGGKRKIIRNVMPKILFAYELPDGNFMADGEMLSYQEMVKKTDIVIVCFANMDTKQTPDHGTETKN